MDQQAEMALLRAEIEALRAQIADVRADCGGGFGPDMGLPLTPVGGDSQGAFAVVDGKITNRYYMAARRWYPDAEDGMWFLVVQHSAPGSATLTTDTDGMTDDTKTVIPLFNIVNGKVTADYRGMPLVMIRE